MKITIDTKEDSHEEIKKVISMLSALVGERMVVNEDFEPAAESSNAFASMFGDAGTSRTTEKKEYKPEPEEIEMIPY